MRRRKLLAALSMALFGQHLSWAGGRVAERVVIVGSGFGGANCARILRQFAPDLDIVLVDAREHFYTGPFTNLAMTGHWPVQRIRFSTAQIAKAHGVRWHPAEVIDIDPLRRRLTLADGQRMDADRIVLAPGVRMRYADIDGLNDGNSQQVPHAWLGDAQLPALRQRLAALKDGATVAIAAPAGAYRCPPGPYERAGLMAWSLQQKGRRSKIVLLDAKGDFTKRGPIQAAWSSLYPGMVEWVPRRAGGRVTGVDVAKQQLRLADGEVVGADLISLIPPQEAATIAHRADLVDASGWCPVEPVGFESRRHAGIHVIGDAADISPMPKSAYAASAQGKLCALAIVADLHALPRPEGLLTNTCYSLLAPDFGVSISASYRVVDGRLNSLSSGQSASFSPRSERAQEARNAYAWYANVTKDSFQ